MGLNTHSRHPKAFAIRTEDVCSQRFYHTLGCWSAIFLVSRCTFWTASEESQGPYWRNKLEPSIGWLNGERMPRETHSWVSAQLYCNWSTTKLLYSDWHANCNGGETVSVKLILPLPSTNGIVYDLWRRQAIFVRPQADSINCSQVANQVKFYKKPSFIRSAKMTGGRWLSKS